MLTITVRNQQEWDALSESFPQITAIEIRVVGTVTLVIMTAPTNSRVEARESSRVEARESSRVEAGGQTTTHHRSTTAPQLYGQADRWGDEKGNV